MFYTLKYVKGHFLQKNSLKLHMYVHNMPHVYNVCQKSFAPKARLIRHMMIHTGENRNLCDICQRAFAQKSHLKRHMLSHTGNKPHAKNSFR